MIEETDPLDTETPPDEPDQSDKLSNRDALEKAISEKREPIKDSPPTEPKEQAPTKSEVKAAVDADPEPPSEFSGDGKKAWRDKDIRGIQKEYSRIHDARTQELTRAQNAERNALAKIRPAESIVEKVREYLTLRGDGTTPTEAQIAEAVSLVVELKKDPVAAKAELERLGFDFSGQGRKETTHEINSLLEDVKALKGYREQEILNRTIQEYDSVFRVLGSQKTRTGDPVYPGLLDHSEQGQRFAHELGSLTQKPDFQAGVLRRFPNADLTILVREAYKYLGGTVAGEPVIVSANNQPKHVEKSRRAAASTPGGVSRRSDSSSLVGKLSNRAALQKAWEDQQEH